MEFRKLEILDFRKTGSPEDWHSGIPEFHISGGAPNTLRSLVSDFPDSIFVSGAPSSSKQVHAELSEQPGRCWSSTVYKDMGKTVEGWFVGLVL